jgi:hypothetical protein
MGMLITYVTTNKTRARIQLIKYTLIQQVSQVCKMARPKIQKWIGDAGEDNAELMGMSYWMV